MVAVYGERMTTSRSTKTQKRLPRPRVLQTGSDIYDPAKRSEIMSRVRARDTIPERVVRSVLHRMGFRFRLHRKDLPGSPDIVLVRLRKVIFVNGCFWHQHFRCAKATIPRARHEWWAQKLERNQERDQESYRALRSRDWKTLVVWECQIRNRVQLELRLRRFLSR
jgi:DNA mismatch endonuclease, patch repair protein